MREFYTIDLPWANAGIETDDCIVVKAAPVFAWMIGNRIEKVEEWVKNKGGHLIRHEAET